MFMEINSQLRTSKCGRLTEDHLGPLSTVSNFDINSLRFLSFFEKPGEGRRAIDQVSVHAVIIAISLIQLILIID